MLGHVMLSTNNLSESIDFYDQVMPVLEYPRVRNINGLLFVMLNKICYQDD